MKYLLISSLVYTWFLFGFFMEPKQDYRFQTSMIEQHLFDDSNLIVWKKDRKLKISDFKRKPLPGIFQAATNSGITYVIKPNQDNSYNIAVYNVFNCDSSYFKRSEFDSFVLAHEQLHFDITEIYARKFFRDLLNIDLKKQGLAQAVNALFKKYNTEMGEVQTQYDIEVHPNPKLQDRWNDRIKNELLQLSEYEAKSVIGYRFDLAGE